jgi:hypothetical protein
VCRWRFAPTGILLARARSLPRTRKAGSNCAWNTSAARCA